MIRIENCRGFCFPFIYSNQFGLIGQMLNLARESPLTGHFIKCIYRSYVEMYLYYNLNFICDVKSHDYRDMQKCIS